MHALKKDRDSDQSESNSNDLPTANEDEIVTATESITENLDDALITSESLAINLNLTKKSKDNNNKSQ